MNPIKLQDGTEIDPTIVKVMKGIKYAERDPNQDEWNQVGDGGDAKGAYQWNSSSGDGWNNSAKKILGDANAPMTPENQNKVAYAQIKAYKDAGHDPEEIAALWNGAKKDPKTGRYIYLNPKYGEKFRTGLGLETQKKTQTSDGYKTSDITTNKTTDGAQGQYSGTLGTNPNDSMYGKIIDNSITRGMMKATPGAQQLGDQVGNSLAYLKEKASGLMGGQDNSQYIPKSNVKDTAIGAAKVVGDVASVYGAGKLLSLASGANTLKSPGVVKAMEKFRMPMQEFNMLSKTEKLNALGEALKGAPTGDALEIAKAINYLAPKSGILKMLASKGIGAVRDYLIYNAIGDKFGGIVDKITK